MIPPTVSVYVHVQPVHLLFSKSWWLAAAFTEVHTVLPALCTMQPSRSANCDVQPSTVLSTDWLLSALRRTPGLYCSTIPVFYHSIRGPISLLLNVAFCGLTLVTWCQFISFLAMSGSLLSSSQWTHYCFSNTCLPPYSCLALRGLCWKSVAMTQCFLFVLWLVFSPCWLSWLCPHCSPPQDACSSMCTSVLMQLLWTASCDLTFYLVSPNSVVLVVTVAT